MYDGDADTSSTWPVLFMLTYWLQALSLSIEVVKILLLKPYTTQATAVTECRESLRTSFSLIKLPVHAADNMWKWTLSTRLPTQNKSLLTRSARGEEAPCTLVVGGVVKQRPHLDGFDVVTAAVGFDLGLNIIVVAMNIVRQKYDVLAVLRVY
eukprot:m.224459 g.224459  ORF g.224459 m.224459 type:complete len:153 (-) comp17290_c0_seq1:620-1078(-)